MSCHVNMMDDTLIQQLPAHLLRSSVRVLIAQGTAAQKTFIEHVRNALGPPKKDFGPPELLFLGSVGKPMSNSISPLSNSPSVFPEEFWSEARCLFSSKMVEESLPYLTHLLQGIRLGKVTWTLDSPLQRHLEHACGDIVQAIQALKESNPQPTESLRNLLWSLKMAIQDCRDYCLANEMICPFNRARLQVADALNLLFPQYSFQISPSSSSSSSSSSSPSPSPSPSPLSTTSQLPLPPNPFTLALSQHHHHHHHHQDIAYPSSPSSSSFSSSLFSSDISLDESNPIIHAHVDNLVSSSLEHVSLGPITVPRLFNGLWQMSSPAWGSASSDRQDAALVELVEHGLVATDMADHYGDAELIYGSFRNRLADQALSQRVIAATKWCIFRPLTRPVTPEFVLEAVEERTRRLGGRVELLQFHWYDYSVKDYLKILEELVKITESHPHLVSAIGLCNFDSEHTREACDHLLSTLGRVGIVSNQVQFSLIDCRPLVDMVKVCKKYSIKLLTYGSFCGGFLSDKWLGKQRPDIYCPSLGLTPSQRKYFDMINQWGSWSELQSLLSLLKSIADNHTIEQQQQIDISNVATRWVLDHPEVGAVLVGTRLGVSSNVASNTRVFSFKLRDEERRAIDAFVCGSRLDSLHGKIGDCGHEYHQRK